MLKVNNSRKFAAFGLLLLVFLSILVANLGAVRALMQHGNIDDLPITHILNSGKARRPAEGATFDIAAVERGLKLSDSVYLKIAISNSAAVSGNVDEVNAPTDKAGFVSGWFSPEKDISASFVAVIYREEIVSVGQVNGERTDVSQALNRPRALWSGFKVELPPISGTDCRVRLLLVLSDLTGSMRDVTSKVCKN